MSGIIPRSTNIVSVSVIFWGVFSFSLVCFSLFSETDRSSKDFPVAIMRHKLNHNVGHGWEG